MQELIDVCRCCFLPSGSWRLLVPGIEFPAFKEVTLGDVKHELIRKVG